MQPDDPVKGFKPAWRGRRVGVTLAIVAALASAPSLLNDALLLVPRDIAGCASCLALPLIGLAFVLVLIGALLRRLAWQDLAWALVALVIVVLGPRLGWPLARSTFARATRRADPLVAAITRYAAAHGAPPPSLDALVPEQIDRVPGTGMRAYPAFEYEAFDDEGGSLLWWDLGPRNGRAFEGLWIYPDGAPDHAILAIEIDHAGVETDARVDRLPQGEGTMPFDGGRWLADPSTRMGMVRSLPDALRARGHVDRTALVTALGPPTGERRLRNTPWELTIPCYGLGSWDVLVYWPTHDYPAYMHGGDAEPIGEWAYVHE